MQEMIMFNRATKEIRFSVRLRFTHVASFARLFSATQQEIRSFKGPNLVSQHPSVLAKNLRLAFGGCLERLGQDGRKLTLELSSRLYYSSNLTYTKVHNLSPSDSISMYSG